MSSPLWLVIEPRPQETRLLLSAAPTGTALKARLPRLPHHPRAVAMFLEALSAWWKRPLTAVLDADALRTQHDAAPWSELLAGLPLDLSVEWVERRAPSSTKRDRFFDDVADSRTARRLLACATTGQR